MACLTFLLRVAGGLASARSDTAANAPASDAHTPPQSARWSLFEKGFHADLNQRGSHLRRPASPRPVTTHRGFPATRLKANDLEAATSLRSTLIPDAGSLPQRNRSGTDEH